jgi:hypothetical protein
MVSKHAVGQEKRKSIYFLADTINVNPNNRIVEIGKEDPISYYSFHCKCIEPYKSDVSLTYNYKERHTDTLSKKPDYKFISWKDFSGILTKEGHNLSEKYFVFITEVLPNNRYITNKVNLVIRRPPIVDFEIIRSNK